MRNLIAILLACAFAACVPNNLPSDPGPVAGASAAALLSPWNPRIGENWVKAVLECESELIPGTAFNFSGQINPLGQSCISNGSYAICVSGVYDSNGMTYGSLVSTTLTSPVVNTYLAKVGTLSSQQAIVRYGRIDFFPWSLGDPTQSRWAHCDTLPGSGNAAILNMNYN